MLVLCVTLLAICSTTIYCDESNNQPAFNETLEKATFKDFFIKIYRLRLVPERNITNTTHSRRRRSALIKFYDAEQRKSKWERISQSDELEKETVNIISEKAWDQVGGKIVKKTFEKAGGISLVGLPERI